MTLHGHLSGPPTAPVPRFSTRASGRRVRLPNPRPKSWGPSRRFASTTIRGSMGDQQSNGKNKERTLRELFENPAFYASSDAPASSDEPATGGGIGVAEPGAMDTSDQGIAVIEEFEPSSGNPTASSSPGGDPEEEPRSFVVSDRRFWAR